MATQTRTFLFADIEGSTAMSRRLGDAHAGVLADYHRLRRAGLAARGGEDVVTRGGECSTVFASPRACADAAIGMRRALAWHVRPAGVWLTGLGRHRLTDGGRAEQIFQVEAGACRRLGAAAVARGARQC